MRQAALRYGLLAGLLLLAWFRPLGGGAEAGTPSRGAFRALALTAHSTPLAAQLRAGAPSEDPPELDAAEPLDPEQPGHVSPSAPGVAWGQARTRGGAPSTARGLRGSLQFHAAAALPRGPPRAG